MTTRKTDVDTGIDPSDSRGVGQGDEDLERALGAGEVEARYRPVVRTGDGSVAGLEVELGVDGPTDATPTADRLAARTAEGGRAARVDERSLELVGRDVRRGAVPRDVEWIALPLSPKSLRVPQVLGRTLRLSGELNRKGHDLVVELSAKDPDLDVAEAALGLSRLRSSGVRAALDHLGEGRFPFSRLADYPLDFVKMRGAGPAGETPVSDPVGYVRALVRVVRAAGPRVIFVLDRETGSSSHAHVLEEADYAVGGRFGAAVPPPELA